MQYVFATAKFRDSRFSAFPCKNVRLCNALAAFGFSLSVLFREDSAMTPEKEAGMSSTGTPFTTVTLEDGTFAVVRSAPRKPNLLEVIAIFSEVARARSYAAMENQSADELIASAAPNKTTVAPPDAKEELSPRQSAVLGALRPKMDNNQQTAEKAADLAKAAQIPLGSLHSVLQSLEKKQLIKTVRVGSARAPAVYKVL